MRLHVHIPKLHTSHMIGYLNLKYLSYSHNDVYVLAECNYCMIKNFFWHRLQNLNLDIRLSSQYMWISGFFQLLIYMGPIIYLLLMAEARTPGQNQMQHLCLLDWSPAFVHFLIRFLDNFWWNHEKIWHFHEIFWISNDIMGM